MIDWSNFEVNTQRAVMTPSGAVVIDVLPEVMALRTNDDGRDRLERAIQLAKDGVIIDHAVDVRQQSAKAVMDLRRSYGYTWVPSLLMPNVAIAPGVSGHFSHLNPYDPGNAPVGAIFVPPY